MCQQSQKIENRNTTKLCNTPKQPSVKNNDSRKLKSPLLEEEMFRNIVASAARRATFKTASRYTAPRAFSSYGESITVSVNVADLYYAKIHSLRFVGKCTI